MKIIVAGGTGFIGRFLVQAYLDAHHEVTVIGRSRAKINHVFSNRVNALDWNTLHQTGLESLRNKDVIINLVGEGIADQKWTKARKETLISSRIVPTTLLATLCAKLKNEAPALLSGS